MPIITSRANSAASGYGFVGKLTVASVEINSAMVLVSPTSITYSGGSASIQSNGSIVATSVYTLTINGVFTSEYSNYLVCCNHKTNTLKSISARFSAGGLHSNTETYSRQNLNSSGTDMTTGYSTSGWMNQFFTTAGNYAGEEIFIYSPYLNAPTSCRTAGALDWSSAEIYDRVYVHNVSTSYDGLHLSSDGASFNLSFYGLVGA